MRKALYLLPAMAAVVWLGQALWRPTAVQSQNRGPAANAQFRIVLGINDREPKTWSGRIAVTRAELAGMEGWRFSQKDHVEAGGSFDFQTKVANLEDQLRTKFPYGQTDWSDPDMRRHIPQGLIVRLQGAESARVKLESTGGNFEFSADRVTFGKPLSVLEGNGLVERLPVEERLSEPGKADDHPSIAVARDGTRWAAWLAYENAADEVVTSDGSRTYRLSGKGDHHAPAIAAGAGGKIHAVWSRNDSGVFHLYASVFDGFNWSGPEKLTRTDGSNIWPHLASDGTGKLMLVWQGFRNNQAVILARAFDGASWGAEAQVSEGTGNCWVPVAAYGGGKLWIAWDSYSTGSYQVYVRQWPGDVQRVTRGANFSVRPALAVNSKGVPIVAWEESDALWGKDFAFLTDRRGSVLYKNRRIRVAWLEASGWKESPGLVAEALPASIRRFAQQPRLALDEEGRLYLAFRSRTSTNTSRIDFWAAGGRWETFLTYMNGDRWAPAIPIPSSLGRNSMAAALALDNGSVHLVWPSDNRAWPGGKYGELDVYAATLKAVAPPAQLSGGRSIPEEAVTTGNPHPREAEDRRRIQSYRYNLNGKQYRILRGDLHRHTELSGDGAGDGSLDDLYRYALDAAAMDYAHVGDHQMGSDEEYNWWITQKSNDLYYMPRRFVPLYGYERSVWWPNGHRNVIWAERGKPVLPIGGAEAKGAADSGPILYPYLRKTDGIATSHTSATEQGTDWRDNDPALEPLVEIYQGFESSYEHEGAPRAWKPGEKPVHQGIRPAGFIWNAWAKGYKLGVQSSSDHISTHASYACILVEDFTRQGLLDAMRKRHAYAATDQIVVDYRIVTAEGTFLMGDITATGSQPKLAVKILGTAPVRQIDVIRNNAYIHKLNPNQRDVSFEFVDTAVAEGENYYYVRVQQADGQLAWSSPVWVTFKK